jgi:hypothetical protein
LHVSLAPDLVSVRRRSRGPRRRELEVGDTAVSQSTTAPDWRAPVRAFAATAEQAGWRNADLEIVLSSHFVQYLVLPWFEKLSAHDALAYARHQLQSRFGADADTWAVCIGRANAGMPRVAAAADAQLIGELRAAGAARGLRLTGVRPLLAAACAALPDKGPPPSGWLAIVERGRMSVSRIEHGHCVSVRSAYCGNEHETSLLNLLDQDALCAGIGAGSAKLYLQACVSVNCDLLRARGWQVLPSELRVLQ